MRKSEIEAWVLSIIDRVVAGQPVEDDRVELKAAWIDAKKAARRIAGHANASRGESALWLIGVDDAGSVPGVELDEFTDWYQAVRACFDELAPEVERLNVPYGGVTVVALLIETDRAPFVVKCQEGGGVAREVPYRHGTRCDAATRGQLVRLLVPLATRPRFELASGNLQIVRNLAGSETSFEFSVTLIGYILQRVDQQTVLAKHRSTIEVVVAGEHYPLTRRLFRPLYSAQHHPPNTTVTLTGATEIEIKAGGIHAVPTGMPLPREDRIEVILSFDVFGFGRITRSLLFEFASREDWRAHWEATYQNNPTDGS